MIINMYEVNFGEAILLEEGDENLVVDCGAKYGRKGNLVAGKVLPDLRMMHKKLLISHFDEDHYNGISEMVGKVIFDKIYLPLYIYDNKAKEIQGTAQVLNDTIKFWCYLKLIGSGKKLDTLQRLFCNLPLLVKSPRDIVCVGKGDHINLAAEQFDILWPERNLKVRKKDYADEMRRILNSYQVEEGMLAELVGEYSAAFTNVYLYYAVRELDQNIDTLMARLVGAYARLESAMINPTLRDRDKKRIHAISSTVIRNMNECSVVASNRNNLLLLGDISDRIYIKEIKTQVVDEYKVVKISHHGTKAYFCGCIPKAQKYLVSNSGPFNIKWSIYEEYERLYSDEMCCTNTNHRRCMSSTKSCSNCKIGQSDGTVYIDTAFI